MATHLEKFQKACKSLEIELTEEHLDKFKLYSKELAKWNEKINLISRKSDTPQDIYRHFLDSLLILNVIKIPFQTNLLDLGSGAGFPGLPLKILRKDIFLTLLESKRKKAFFLEHIVDILNLKNTNVINQRAEELSLNSFYAERMHKHIEKYDLITARFLGKLNKITKIAYPFLKVRGVLVCYKGKSIKEELKNLSKNFELENKFFYENSEFSLQRNLIILKKIK